MSTKIFAILRLLLTIVVLLALLLGIGLTGASWWIMREMGPEVWVARLEQHCNCRAQIGDAKLSLFSRPASLRFVDVKIAPRDAEVETPLNKRTPLAVGAASIEIQEIVFDVHLDDLLNKRLQVEKLLIRSPKIVETQDAQGHSSLEKLFQRPGAPTEYPSASNRPPPPSQPVASAPPSSDSDGFAYAVKNAALERGQLTITTGNSVVSISGLDFSLTDIDISPADLTRHNHMHAILRAEIEVNGQARIGGVKRPAQLANLKLTGEGDMAPLDPVTGRWSPSTVLKLTLAQGSVLAGHITIGDAAGKEMKKLQEYGVDLAPVKVGGALQEPAVVDGIYRNNQLYLRSETRFSFPDYEVLIEKGSWINSAQDSHKMDFHLSCGAALQKHLYSGVAKAKLGESMTNGIIKALSDERGRMTFDIESEGPLSDPKITPKLDRILKNLVRGQGLGDLLQGLFKKL